MDINSLHPLETKFFRSLSENQVFSPESFGENQDLTPENVRGVIGWFKAKDWLSIVEELTLVKAELTEEGKIYIKKGLPLREVWNMLSSSPSTIMDIMKKTLFSQQEIGKAVGFLKKNGFIEEKEGVLCLVSLKTPEYIETLERLLSEGTRHDIILSSLTDKDSAVLDDNAKKRGSGSIFRLKEQKQVKYRLNEEGERARRIVISSELKDQIGNLTPEILREKSWEGRKFRKFGISLKPKSKPLGRLHPYGRFLDTVRKELISMGFEEMKGPIVESEFYNMDVLFMPQHHSARDIHDIYLVKDPQKASDIPSAILSKIASAHRDGGRSGSRGWGYDFDTEKTQRLVLRSQGTAISARTMTKKPPIPGKFFAIARCFRYDSVDATHAPDFFQIEGIVMEENINFRHLLGLLSTFAEKLAHAEEIKFVPGYFPFTEPSVEAMIKHPQLGWIELGGAGIFRPEITVSLDIPCPVIAWGLGLDRMAMNALKINDIRELFTQDIEKIRSSKVVI